MPNIHRLGDAPANNNSNRRPGAPSRASNNSASDLENQQSDFNLFGNGPSPDSSPLPTVGQLLCPRFKASYKSLIFMVSILDIIMFIVSLILNAVDYGHAFDTSNKMLGPSAFTFLKLRAKYTPYIKQGQVDRLLVPVFLHAGIIHLLFNLFFQCNVGFRMEEVWGVPRLAAIYLASGIGGNLMSALISVNSISVGASGSLFGILGGMVAFLIQNWSDIPGACMNLCNVVLMVVINFLLGFSGLVDNYAHLGGLISGFVVALALPKKISGLYEAKDSNMRNAGAFLSLTYFAVTIAVLFAT